MLNLLIAFLISLGAGIVILLAQERMRRWIWDLWTQIRDRHPSEAILGDVGIFEGRIEILTDQLLSRKLSAEQRAAYYGANRPLDWDVIAARADVPRDQQEELIELLKSTDNSLRFITILGESGTGKSTLAWRIAAELYKRNKAIVLRVKGNDEPVVWYQMSDFCNGLEFPVLVLADDLFRHEGVRRALRQLNPWLQITVLATSQTHEYRPMRLKGQMVSVELADLSRREVDRAHVWLGKAPWNNSQSETASRKSAKDFLVLMSELTTGRGFASIVEDSMKTLARNRPSVHRAYQYLCFAYTYGLTTPATLLKRAVATNDVGELPNEQDLAGLFYSDESRPNCLKPGHVRRAQIVSNMLLTRQQPIDVVNTLVLAADLDEPDHRLFIASMFRNIAYRSIDIVTKMPPDLQDRVDNMLRRSATLKEVSAWQHYCLYVGRYEDSEHLTNKVFEFSPISAHQINDAVNVFRQMGREPDALRLLNRYIGSGAELRVFGEAYLKLVEKFGNADEITQAIKSYATWLAEHPHEQQIRATYIGVVERNSSIEQIRRLIDELAVWLEKHPNDVHVRAPFLGFVERNATFDQLQRAIEKTADWLTLHPNDVHVRVTFLGLVERKATVEQIQRAIDETADWLALHPDDLHLRVPYLGLVERKATTEQFQRAINETVDWLGSHPNATHLRVHFLGTIERQGTAEQIEHQIRETSDWLADHPDEAHVRQGFLALVERSGSPETIDRAIEETVNWLRSHPRAENVWTRLLHIFESLDRKEEAKQHIKDFIAGCNWNPQRIIEFMRLVQDLLTQTEILQIYENAIRSNPRYFVTRMSYARWLASVGRTSDAEEQFKTLIERQGEKFQVRYAYGRFLLGSNRYREAEQQFRQVLTSHRGHQMAHDGLATALRGTATAEEESGNHTKAVELITEAEREFLSAINWATINNGKTGMFFAHLGWLYIDIKRWKEALGAFDDALSEDPEYFAYYWGKGRALVGLERWHEASRILQTAVRKAPETLTPPASDEIPNLIRECEVMLMQHDRHSRIVNAE